MQRDQKKEYIKRKFIQATKKIIETQGINHVSARKVGQIAGFSYATIYNHYEDIDDLLVETAIDYLDSSYEHMIQFIKDDMSPKDRLYYLAKGYITYMYNNPELFRIIFIRDYGNHTIEYSMKLLPRVLFEIRNTLEMFSNEELVGSVDDTFKLLSSATHGKLMFSILKRDRISLEQILKSIEKEISIVTGGKI